MNRSFYNGVIGIKSHQTGIDIIANNISNIKSTAFKEDIPEFETIFSQTLTGDYSPTTDDIGLGSSVPSVSRNLSQGSFLNTDNTFDLALQGEGWFGVKDNTGVISYTRDGSFSIDANRDVTTATGLYLLGVLGDNLTPTTLPQDKMDKLGKIYNKSTQKSEKVYAIKEIDSIPLTNKVSKINLPDMLYLPSKPTTKVSYKANLDPTIRYDENGNEISNKEHFTTSIISPTGDKDILDMSFSKVVPQQQSGIVWNADIKILHFEGEYNSDNTYDPTRYVVYPEQNEVYSIVDEKTGTLTFNESGAFLGSTVPTLSNGNTTLTMNFGTPLNDNNSNSGYDGLISIEGGNFEHSAKKDGQIEGFLTDYGIDENGNIIANFDNGKAIPVAKIGVYHFQNDQGLEKLSGSFFRESSNSGKAFFYKDKDGNFFNGTKILSHKLEQSNVSLSNAMTELIIMQKAFDANAKSITTSDQMIQRAINMKR